MLRFMLLFENANEQNFELYDAGHKELLFPVFISIIH